MTIPGSLAQPSQARESKKCNERRFRWAFYSFLARRIVVDEKVSTFGDNARRYNICCTERSNSFATCTRSSVPSALRIEFSSAVAMQRSSPVHEYKQQDVVPCGPTCAEHYQDWMRSGHGRWPKFDQQILCIPDFGTLCIAPRFSKALQCR